MDPDPRALARAARKARRAGVAVRFDRGFAGALPYPDASFDRVLSSFMFHHLDLAEKQRALREVVRVLRPGGSLHLLDFGGSQDLSDGIAARIAHHNRHLQDNLGDRIPTLMREAGLADPRETGHRVTVIGRYTFFRARHGT
jgi:ubiquinone/menaquinone biosynthesis C-methylase UbiE